MSSWLSMPGSLRKPEVRELILARRRNDPAAFCDAYLRWHGPDISDEWQQLLTRARQRDKTAFDELWRIFLNSATEEGAITDPAASRQLDIARSPYLAAHRDARDALIRHLDGEVDKYRESKLYDRSETTANKSVETRIEIDRDGDIAASVRYETEVDNPPDETEIDDTPANRNVWDYWDDLTDNIIASAERLWRDAFLETDFTEKSSGKYSGSLPDITRASHRLMLLWLEAKLYRARSLYNQEGRGLISGQSIKKQKGRPLTSGEAIRKQIRDYVHEYRGIIAQWRKELRKATHQRYFVDQGLESQQLRRLIRQFSKPHDQELGWAAQATDAQDELRYQLRDDLRREALATGHPFAWLGLLILRFTTGYGTRPVYFIRTALATLGIDMVLFFLNDRFHSWLDPQGPACVLSRPPSQQWSDVVPFVLNSLMHYLYLAATTLTSLGADTSLATYCHSWSSQALLVVSAAFGYFMLGLLGALLYTQLTQRD